MPFFIPNSSHWRRMFLISLWVKYSRLLNLLSDTFIRRPNTSTACLATSILATYSSPVEALITSSPSSSSLTSVIEGGWDVITSLGLGVGSTSSLPFLFFFPFQIFFPPSKWMFVVQAPFMSPSIVIPLVSSFALIPRCYRHKVLLKLRATPDKLLMNLSRSCYLK